MRTIKVASYNIRHGEDADFDMSLLADCIKSVGAEIVGIQEMDRCADRSQNRDQLCELQAALGYDYGFFINCIHIKGGQYGTAIVSKYPIERVKEYELPLHEGGEPRKLGVYTLNVDGDELVFANTHLDFVTKEATKAQMLEVDRLLQSYDRLVLTGDFNTDNMELFRKIENVDYVMNEKTALVTFPASGETIDNIVYRGDIEVKDFGTVQNSHSDHYMLWAELAIG